MIDELYAIYGSSGFGREVMPILRDLMTNTSIPQKFVFIDDGDENESANGHEIVTFEKYLEIPAKKRFVTIAIANSSLREMLEEKCINKGIKFLTIHPSNAVFTDGVDLSEGAILNQFVVLSSNIKVGKQFHINSYSYIGHDCVIGDYVTFAPGVKCNGNVHIEDHAYIGTGAIIKQGTPDKPLVIGRGAVVGMGAVVTKSVPAGLTVVGNPARPLIKS